MNASEKDETTIWIEETLKRYGEDLVLKYTWECLFLTQTQLRDEGKLKQLDKV